MHWKRYNIQCRGYFLRLEKLQIYYGCWANHKVKVLPKLELAFVRENLDLKSLRVKIGNVYMYNIRLLLLILSFVRFSNKLKKINYPKVAQIPAQKSKKVKSKSHFPNLSVRNSSKSSLVNRKLSLKRSFPDLSMLNLANKIKGYVFNRLKCLVDASTSEL